MSTETRISLVFASQVVAYAIICINIRAVAQADYLVTVTSDLIFAFLNFYAIRRIASGEQTTSTCYAYAFGSAIGSIIGVYASSNL